LILRQRNGTSRLGFEAADSEETLVPTVLCFALHGGRVGRPFHCRRRQSSLLPTLKAS